MNEIELSKGEDELAKLMGKALDTMIIYELMDRLGDGEGYSQLVEE